jgi:hypothetical protein
MGTQLLAVGGVRMFRYALGTLLLLAGTALLVAKGLVWLDLEPRMLRALQGDHSVRWARLWVRCRYW